MLASTSLLKVLAPNVDNCLPSYLVCVLWRIIMKPYKRREERHSSTAEASNKEPILAQVIHEYPHEVFSSVGKSECRIKGR